MARSAGLIGIATMASRLLGVVREMVLASLFGASATPAMDAFNVAFRVPNLVRDLFAEGAMTAAFVPTFTKTLQTRGREAAWRLGNLVINTLLVATGAIVVLAILFADPITRTIASGAEFAAVPGKLELTTQLTRIMMPFLTTVAVAVAVMGMLNALHRFFLPALSPAMFNVVTILGAFLIVPLMEPIGLPPHCGDRDRHGPWRPGADRHPVAGPAQGGLSLPRDARLPRSRSAADTALMGPATLGLAAVQINVLVNTSLATTEPQGAVTWLQVAFRLMYLPIGLFGVSVATAALPDLSKHAANDDRESMRRTVSTALRMMLMLNVPATIGLVVLAHPIVELLLEYRPVPSHGHDRDGRGADVLRAWAHRLLRGQDRLAELLLAGQQPDSRDRQRREHRRQSRLEHHAGQGPGIPRAGARHGNRRHVQRQHAALPARPAPRRPRPPPYHGLFRQDPRSPRS